jgi:hypothetical protein
MAEDGALSTHSSLAVHRYHCFFCFFFFFFWEGALPTKAPNIVFRLINRVIIA